MDKKKLPDHAYLQSVHVKGFRTLKDSEVSFVPGLNIIIGENGAGKSNLLLLTEECYRNEKLTFYFQQFQSKIGYKQDSLELDLSFHPVIIADKKSPIFYNNLAHLLKKISPASSREEYFDGPYLSKIYELTKFYITLIRFNIPDDTNFLQPTTIILRNISSTPDNLYNVSMMNGGAYSFLGEQSFDPFWKISLDSDIKNLVKKNLALDPETVNNLMKYSPIEDSKLSDNFFLTSHSEGVFVDNIHYEFLINGTWLPWSALSDGTKRLFYLIHKVTTAQSTVLIEEPELGVHPHQFHSLMLFLKEQAQEKQIILTTHSPHALNVLRKSELDSIIIAKLDKEKGSVFKHLNEEQKAKAIRYMTEENYLAEYWMYSDLEDDEEQD